MWANQGNDYEGGFYGQSTQQQGPGTPSGGADRKRRANTIIPINISDILDAREDTILVEGHELGWAVIVGEVVALDQQATKIVYTVRDATGTIQCSHFREENAPPCDISENMLVRVIGHPRVQVDKKHLLVSKITVDSDAELDGHQLEIEYAKLQIRMMNEREKAKIGGGMSTQFNTFNMANNSMVSSGLGNMGNGLTPGLNSKQDSVYKIVLSCAQEEGISRKELYEQIGSRMSRADVDSAIEHLSNEGHIYCTTDENHFKSTDG